jgi:hypothetical protein
MSAMTALVWELDAAQAFAELGVIDSKKNRTDNLNRQSQAVT